MEQADGKSLSVFRDDLVAIVMFMEEQQYSRTRFSNYVTEGWWYIKCFIAVVGSSVGKGYFKMPLNNIIFILVVIFSIKLILIWKLTSLEFTKQNVLNCTTRYYQAQTLF